MLYLDNEDAIGIKGYTFDIRCNLFVMKRRKDRTCAFETYQENLNRYNTDFNILYSKVVTSYQWCSISCMLVYKL